MPHRLPHVITLAHTKEKNKKLGAKPCTTTYPLYIFRLKFFLHSLFLQFLRTKRVKKKTQNWKLNFLYFFIFFQEINSKTRKKRDAKRITITIIIRLCRFC